MLLKLNRRILGLLLTGVFIVIFANFYNYNFSQKDPKDTFLLIIEGAVFNLQSKPRGISKVWHHLLEQLSTSPNIPFARSLCSNSSSDVVYKIVYIDKSPKSFSSRHFANLRVKCPDSSSKQAITIYKMGSSLENVVQQIITTTLSPEKKNLIFYISTYYDYPDFRDFPQICYLLMVHDLMPEDWMNGPPPPHSEFYPRVAALSHVSSIVSVSEATSRDLFKWYSNLIQPNLHLWEELGYPAQTSHKIDNGTIISTVSLSCDHRIYKGTPNQEELNRFLYSKRIFFKYFLFVGWRRGTDKLFQALDILPAELVDHIGVLAIGSDKLEKEAAANLKRHKFSTNCEKSYYSPTKIEAATICIAQFEYPTDEEKYFFMAGSLAVTYISYLEGFGLPVLEALCSGTFVITVNTSSLPEAGGQEAPFFLRVDHSISELAEIVRRIITMSSEDRGRIIDLGFKHVAKIGSWERAAVEFTQHLHSTKHRHQKCYIAK